ncbi:amidohydrolase [Leucobacter sp. UCMA 4100]|uniref:amidohydrolase n=1 Tax=Leucobacter sp. UCMA 4100 TaxID=2810534 RepID=UPI0022EA92F7|nr:amidohydrolase [Leucobacter sp. UCMA 4100]MDA3147303.1 amidohydrolase [Leucobacter sp. UCMA 4100]
MSVEVIVEAVTLFDGEKLHERPVSVAVSQGVFTAVSGGSLRHLAGPETRVIDGAGAFMMPGLVDVHNHHAVAGRADLFELSIPVGASASEVLEAVARHASDLSQDAWITGGPWGTNLLNELNTLSMRAKLDEASGGRPVVLIEDSRHNRWASSEALRLAGIEVADAQAGVLAEAGSTEPTGVLLEGAGLKVEQAMAAAGGITALQHRMSSARGVEVLNSFGVTAFQDAATSLPMLQALAELDTEGELNAWVVSSLTMNDDIFGFDPIGQVLIDQSEAYRTPHHRPDFVKIFLDGVPPARTAAFLEPYLADEQHGCEHRGELLISHDDFAALMAELAGQGLNVKVHCAGDASAREVLNVVETLRAGGDWGTRVHIAHGQILAPSDLPRLGELAVTADMSPFVWFPGVIPHALSQVLPAHTLEKFQPSRDLLTLGAKLAMGSAWPVSPTPNPWVGIHGLVTREDPFRQWPGELCPDQALTVVEALTVCTSGGAEAMGLGEVTGRVREGFSADFVMLDTNPFTEPVTTLVDTRVRETWFCGRSVYRNEHAR